MIKRLIRFIFKYIIRAPWGTHSCPTLVGYIIPQVYHAVGISFPTSVGNIIRTNGALNGNLTIETYIQQGSAGEGNFLNRALGIRLGY